MSPSFDATTTARFSNTAPYSARPSCASPPVSSSQRSSYGPLRSSPLSGSPSPRPSSSTRRSGAYRTSSIWTPRASAMVQRPSTPNAGSSTRPSAVSIFNGARPSVPHFYDLHDPPESPTQAKPEPTIYDVVPRLDEVPERPQKPSEVTQKCAIAQARSRDLQNIFVSRHSEESEVLRARLSALTNESNQLKLRIAILERDLQEATFERVKDVHADRIAANTANVSEEERADIRIEVEAMDSLRYPMETGVSGRLGFDLTPNLNPSPRRSPRVVAESERLSAEHDFGLWDGSTTSTTLLDTSGFAITPRRVSNASGPSQQGAATLGVGSREPSRDPSPSPRRASDIRARSAQPGLVSLDSDALNSPGTEGTDPLDLAPPEQDDRRGQYAADRKYQEDVLMPLLVRRRAEARFKEASLVHEGSISQMKVELQEIERRMVKQNNWMKHVDSEILKVENTKARYQVRLDHARKRVASLGKDLSHAYVVMGKIMDRRMEVEELVAKNDALVWYQHLLRRADQENSKNFIENRTDLNALNEKTEEVRRKRAKLDRYLEQIRCSQLLALDIGKHGDELTWLSEQLQQLWNLVPIEWKDSVFKSVQKGFTSPLAMHPLNAIQALQTTSKHITGSMKQLLKSFEEFLDVCVSHSNRRRAFRGALHKGVSALQFQKSGAPDETDAQKPEE